MGVVILKEYVLKCVWDEAPAWVSRLVERVLVEEFENGYQAGWEAHKRWSMQDE